MPKLGTNKFVMPEHAQEAINASSGPLKFFSKAEAAKFFDCDYRTLHHVQEHFELDPDLNPSIKWVTCSACGEKAKSAHCRQGYCKKCSKAGEGRKAQGKWFKAKQTGSSNTNYTTGNSRRNFRNINTKKYKEWRDAALEEAGVSCAISGTVGKLHVHHILPYALFPDHKFDLWNAVVLDPVIHTELHRLRLDIVLLPSLFESGLDAQGLRSEFCRQPQVQSLRPLGGQPWDRYSLLRAVPKNYRKTAQDLLPVEFLQAWVPEALK